VDVLHAGVVICIDRILLELQDSNLFIIYYIAMPIPFSCAFTPSSTFVSSVRRRNGCSSNVAIGSPGITSKINRSPSLRRASRSINVRLVFNLIFASGPFYGLFSPSLKSRCIARLKETCCEAEATGMDWMNARTGSA